MLYCMHVKGSFLDRDDKKRSASMDMKAERHGLADDYIGDMSDVSFVGLLHRNAYCCEIYYLCYYHSVVR